MRPLDGLLERDGAFFAGDADFLGDVFFAEAGAAFLGEGDRFPDLRALLGLLLLVLLALLGDLLLLTVFFAEAALDSERAGEADERALLARLAGFFAATFFEAFGS